jgi:hypothetical protein
MVILTGLDQWFQGGGDGWRGKLLVEWMGRGYASQRPRAKMRGAR